MNRRPSEILCSAFRILSTLLMEKRAERQMAKIAASITHYYDSLSEEEMEEDQVWGAFAESQFPLG